MKTTAGDAHILVIGDDPDLTAAYGAELQASHYQVRTATTFMQALSTASVECDLIVLCGLAVIAHPGHGSVPVLMIRDRVEPATVVRQVHGRVAMRAMLQAVEAAAA